MANKKIIAGKLEFKNKADESTSLPTCQNRKIRVFQGYGEQGLPFQLTIESKGYIEKKVLEKDLPLKIAQFAEKFRKEFPRPNLLSLILEINDICGDKEIVNLAVTFTYESEEKSEEKKLYCAGFSIGDGIISSPTNKSESKILKGPKATKDVFYERFSANAKEISANDIYFHPYEIQRGNTIEHFHGINEKNYGKGISFTIPSVEEQKQNQEAFKNHCPIKMFLASAAIAALGGIGIATGVVTFSVIWPAFVVGAVLALAGLGYWAHKTDFFKGCCEMPEGYDQQYMYSVGHW
jgi:hypothetical protein